jgi:DNA-directed RNA polymerase subunit beta
MLLFLSQDILGLFPCKNNTVSTPMARSTRQNFGKEEKKLPEVDLSSVQKESWDWFLEEAITQELSEISPIDDFTGKNWQLVLANPSLGEPKVSPRAAQEKGLTYSSPMKISATLINKKNGKEKKQDVFLGDLPQMTQRGTFIVNGVERAVINQIVRSPGVYFSGKLDVSSGRMLYMAEVRPLRGSWLEFEVSRNDILAARIDRRRKVVATVLLRAMGVESNSQLIDTFKEVDTDSQHKYLTATVEKDPTENREEALLEVYRKLRPGEPVVLENAEALFNGLFFEARRYDLGRVGRFKINKRLGLTLPNERTTWVLTPQDVIATLAYLIKLQKGEGRVDDIDHLANRRLRRVGELVATNAFRIGLLRLERSVKEKMSLISPDDDPAPANLINARPLIASLNEFFRSNQLSTILDDTNPLSEIDNLRRISVLGPGGINRERASFSIRDVNSSQYGRIDPVRTPEGPNIGLVTYLALYARINEYGFIETPYKKVKKIKRGRKTRVKLTDEIVYLAADDEEGYHITHSGINLDKRGYITDKRVPYRYKGSVSEGPVENVDLVDISARQVVGAASSLIPFLAHDDGNRALMGSNMQCQAVPLVRPEAPVVGTGMEGKIAEGMGRVTRARHSGVVEYADAQEIEVKLNKKEPGELSSEDVEVTEGGRKEIYHLTKFKRTSHSTCYNQRVKVRPGDKVRKGDLLADGPAIDDGELALGKNLVIAYASFEGYGFEDAILISDQLVRKDMLTSVHIEEYEADVVDTKLGPEELTRDIPNVAETDLANLAEDGIVVVGAEVGPNDILVGKIAPKGETELTAEERLLRAIFGEKAREVRDTSLRVPHGEQGIVVNVSVLDKDKGDELGPGVMKRVIVKVVQMRKITVGDKIAGRHGNKGVIAKILPVADMPYLEDGTPIDIIISPLSVLARMNLGQLLEAHLGWALNKKEEKASLPVFERVEEDVIVKELESAGLPVTGKTRLYDGRSGELFKEDTVVGIGYIMKLTHMVEDKTHARSTGPYSLVTQQPLGGKAQMGGQRLGEMEVWALESHRAAYTLQEMLTIKSDDVLGRARAFEAIVKGVDIPEATVPESFRVLVRELNSLGLSLEAKGGPYEGEQGEILEGEGRELEKVAGGETVATKELLEPSGPMEVEEAATKG